MNASGNEAAAGLTTVVTRTSTPIEGGTLAHMEHVGLPTRGRSQLPGQAHTRRRILAGLGRVAPRLE